jgi:hypothetical protein
LDALVPWDILSARPPEFLARNSKRRKAPPASFRKS